MEKKVNVTVGPGVGGLLGVLFVALKLTGQIDNGRGFGYSHRSGFPLQSFWELLVLCW